MTKLLTISRIRLISERKSSCEVIHESWGGNCKWTHESKIGSGKWIDEKDIREKCSKCSWETKLYSFASVQ